MIFNDLWVMNKYLQKDIRNFIITFITKLRIKFIAETNEN